MLRWLLVSAIAADLYALTGKALKTRNREAAANSETALLPPHMRTSRMPTAPRKAACPADAACLAELHSVKKNFATLLSTAVP